MRTANPSIQTATQNESCKTTMIVFLALLLDYRFIPTETSTPATEPRVGIGPWEPGAWIWSSLVLAMKTRSKR